ncbi:hypothetical protein K239x_45060 [Planctomycetes bacterium K23_9]|uniref:Uncharacterized protein n=1 Tax=Stieleria marina TaxID=1930275 RepID=A0A517NZE5_9BACT|nr:hypothetical protein K239x_45060 [Planctomycetes bacterium K23_9]
MENFRQRKMRVQRFERKEILSWSKGGVGFEG